MKKIYVGNFSFHLGENDLRSMFEPYGHVESVTLVTDRDSGRSRGFGFVEMSEDQDAASAIAALNGRDSDGRSLTVNEARPKGVRAGGRGGDGRGRQPRW